MSAVLLFWLIAAAMVALALVFAFPGLFARRAPTTRARRAESNAAIYRSELADLARERAEGRLTEPQYARAHEEIERRLLSDAAGDCALPVSAPPPRGAAVVIAIALPILAFGLYAAFGDPAALNSVPGAASAPDESPDAIPARRDDLVRHLARNTRDGRGWVLLARMDFEMDRFDDAAAAYEKAVASTPKVASDAGVWCEYADALGMVQGGTLAGRPRELVMRALRLDATHPKALEMAGSAAYEQHDFAAAAGYWRQLLGQLPERSVRHQELAAAIARAERMSLAAGRAGDGPR